MSKGKAVLNWIGRILFLLGCVWFLLPFLHGGFSTGAAFGFCVCLGGFLLFTYYGRLSRQGGWKKAGVRLWACCYGAGLAWAAYLTVLMLSVQAQVPPENATVIVLGSQVYSVERMGVSLTNRINAAFNYLVENPTSRVIVTGGQGGDEPCPEALTEKNALVKMGIDEDRIFMEDTSTNTRENLENAMSIARENGLGPEFLLSTQGFHQFRAQQLADFASLSPRDHFYPLAAETDPILFPEYYGRELLSLTKFHIQTVPEMMAVAFVAQGPAEDLANQPGGAG